MEKVLKSIWKFIDFIAYKILVELLHIKWFEKNWTGFMQFVKFGLVGVSNTLINYIVYLILIHGGLHYLLASVIGFFVSVANAFYWNNKYVFARQEGEHRSVLQALVKTFLAYAGTGLVLQNILLMLLVDMAHVKASLGPLLCLVITVPLNYVLNKLWAFRKK